jgi:purine-nucleoside phosphorylase
MYKSFTATDYRKHLGLTSDYSIDGFMVYGTFRKYPFEQFEDSLKRHGHEYKVNKLEHDFFSSLVEFEIKDKKYWLAIAYGGAMLSEYLHLACLFGSKKNILLGSCGGLRKGANSLELIIPEWSYADESSAKAYQKVSYNKYLASPGLSEKLVSKLSEKYKVHRGGTITYQAMMAETWEDVQNWSQSGYIGVEMEAATVFAVSNHFNIPAAAVLRIGDNLIEQETVMDVNYENTKDKRREISQDAFDVIVQELLTQ